MLGDETGMLKLLFDPRTHKLLGVHALEQRATEILHVGQAVLFYGGSVEYFWDVVFNYPTLAEAYKVAAFDGLNKLWSMGSRTGKRRKSNSRFWNWVDNTCA